VQPEKSNSVVVGEGSVWAAAGEAMRTRARAAAARRRRRGRSTGVDAATTVTIFHRGR
jgi:hypothetical protein